MGLRNIRDIHSIRLDGTPNDPRGPTGARVFDILRSDPQSRFDNAGIQNAGLFLLRQLQFVRSKIAKVEYPANKCLTFLPLATDIPASVSQYVYYTRDRTGKSRMQNANAKGPIPRFDVFSSERYGKVVSLEGCYGWTIDELREAARLMVDLPTMKNENARDILLRDTDEVLRTGQLTFADNSEPAQVASGIGGFCNHAEIAISGVAITVTNEDLVTTASHTYGTASHDWFLTAGTTTADQIVGDLFDMEQTIKTATLATGMDNLSLVLATPLMTVLSSTKMSQASDKTALQYYLENTRYVKGVEEWIYLDNAGGTDSGTGAASNKHRAIMYNRNPDTLEAVNPIEFEQQAAQVEGFEFTIPCRAKVGGVKVYRPRSCLYKDFSTKTS
jgi:hypothetical protein